VLEGLAPCGNGDKFRYQAASNFPDFAKGVPAWRQIQRLGAREPPASQLARLGHRLKTTGIVREPELAAAVGLIFA
jgi:hypothetical protein